MLVALCHWGAGTRATTRARFISPTALMLSMTANIDRAAAAGRPLVAGMAAGRETFTLRPDARGESWRRRGCTTAAPSP